MLGRGVTHVRLCVADMMCSPSVVDDYCRSNLRLKSRSVLSSRECVPFDTVNTVSRSSSQALVRPGSKEQPRKTSDEITECCDVANEELNSVSNNFDCNVTAPQTDDRQTDRQTERHTDKQTGDRQTTGHTYSVSQKIPPLSFSDSFPKRLGIFNQFLHTYCTIISTLDYKFLFKYLQL